MIADHDIQRHAATHTVPRHYLGHAPEAHAIAIVAVGVVEQCATVSATTGIMLTFDDFLIDVEQFGQRIQPLMKTRQDKLKAVA